MKAPYIIMAPPYRHTSAGVRALYRLKDELIKRGYQATICQGGKAPFGSIVVYPEIVAGNPLQGKTVARWVLNYPGLLAGDKEYDKNELIFTWSELYYDAPLLMLPLIEDFFKNENMPRSGGCFWVGKGANNPDFKLLPMTDGLTEITYEWPATREALANLFNEKEYFFTYDNNTVMSREAEMCGCKVVVIGEKLESDYDEFVRDYESQVENFIAVTQNAVDKVKVSFGVMINDFQRYDMVLKQSELDPGIHCHWLKSPESATKGLNKLLGIMEAEGADIAVLTHQDMFFRNGWVELMKEKISELPESWVVAGVVGKDMDGNICGKFHDMRIPLHFNTGHRHKFPVPASCFDEAVIIVNLKKGFRFDERLDGFDIYGTMCVLQAWERNETAWIIEAFCEHYCMRPFSWFPDEVFAKRWKWLFDTYKDAPKIDSTVFGVPKNEPEILKPENMFPKAEAA